MIEIDWQQMDPYGLIARVPAVAFDGALGFYVIYVEPRPAYCDRGNWKVLMDHTGGIDLDEQDAFPRYYFSLDTLKSEMVAWVNKRAACLKAAGP